MDKGKKHVNEQSQQFLFVAIGFFSQIIQSEWLKNNRPFLMIACRLYIRLSLVRIGGLGKLLS